MEVIADELPPISRGRAVLESPYTVLAIVALLCHGLQVFCDYKIWDGWLVADWQRTGGYDAMWRQYSEAGAPQQYFVHRFFNLFGTGVWRYKLASLLAYFGTGCGCYCLMVRTGFLKHQAALLTSAFVVTCPGLMTLGDAALLPYVLGTLATFWAACAAVHAEFQSGALHVGWRLLSIGLFFLGMTYYAMVVFYLAFYLLFLWFLRAMDPPESFLDFAGLVAKRADYLLLPLVFWIGRGRWMPTHGHYAGYNTPKLDPANFTEAYGSLFTRYLPGHFSELATNPLILLLVVAVAVMLARRWPLRQPRSWRRLFVMLGVGVFLIVLGCFPYACVKRTFDAATYSSNASQLIPIGGGFILAGLVGVVRLLLWRDRQGITAMLLLVYLLVSFCGIWWGNSLHWQALAAKEKSIARKLRELAPARDVSIFFIVDSFPIPKTDRYPPAITGVQIQQAFDDRSRFGFETPWFTEVGIPGRVPAPFIEKQIVDSTLSFYFDRVDVGGRQGLLQIGPGKRVGSPEEVALEYLSYQYFRFGRGAQYAAFLDGLTDVHVIPLR